MQASMYNDWLDSETVKRNLSMRVEQLEQELHDALNSFAKKLLEEQLRAQRWHYIAQTFYNARFSQNKEQILWASLQFEEEESKDSNG